MTAVVNRPPGVIELDPVDVANALMRAYAQIRLDMTLLLHNTPQQSAATVLLNKVHVDLSRELNLDAMIVTSLMAQVVMNEQDMFEPEDDGGEDSSG